MNERLDDIFHVMSDSLRRQLLAMLAASSQEPISIPELLFAEDPTQEPLFLELIHHHLPKLHAAGVIEYDSESLTVSQGPRFDEIRPFLEISQEFGDGSQELVFDGYGILCCR